MLTTVQLAAQNQMSDSICVKAYNCGDSIDIQITVYKIETQLMFLMQGLNIQVIQPDTTLISFPSAVMVKNKVKRHPNEVKATLLSQTRYNNVGRDSINQVIRPDVRPLIEALNDTTILTICKEKIVNTHNFSIKVNTEKATMMFKTKLQKELINEGDFLSLYIYSVPVFKNNTAEFSGMKLSDERNRSNGLGEGITKDNRNDKIFKLKTIVKLE